LQALSTHDKYLRKTKANTTACLDRGWRILDVNFTQKYTHTILF